MMMCYIQSLFVTNMYKKLNVELTIVLRRRSKTATESMGLFISGLILPRIKDQIVPPNMSNEKPKKLCESGVPAPGQRLTIQNALQNGRKNGSFV